MFIKVFHRPVKEKTSFHLIGQNISAASFNLGNFFFRVTNAMQIGV
jgi:hypothetical protein